MTKLFLALAAAIFIVGACLPADDPNVEFAIGMAISWAVCTAIYGYEGGENVRAK